MAANLENPIFRMYYKKHRLSFKLGSYHALLRTLIIGHNVEQMYSVSSLKDDTFHRLQRTREVIKQLIIFGIQSPEGKDAIDRLNHVHKRLTVDNDAFRYVLSCFFLEPLRWNRLYSRHPLIREDQAHLVDFWIDVGKAMGIKNVDLSLPQWEAFQVQYESRFKRRSVLSKELAQKSIQEVVKLNTPYGLQTVSRQMILSTLDPHVRSFLGLPSAFSPIDGLIDWLFKRKAPCI